ncbi:tape measure protein [Rodentibacter sp. Ppn85]|uniref:tape measure protein n=1 Tax=Rodentibacter sp. Ppn85 TaxID=1908525 RepID=UPI000985FC9F|nr:tape measure protein [Rodentibacter sp. Ppn85]OOF65125.1 phage tail protein [Rodentibacter sp. Ppn85]
MAETLTLAMRIKADVDSALRNLKQIKAELSGTGAASDRLGVQGKAGAQGLNTLDKATVLLNKNLKQTKSDITHVTQQLNSFKSQLLGFAAITGVSLGVKSILLDADAMNSYQARIRLVSRSNNEAKGTFRELMDISNETGNAFASTAELYTRVFRALGNKANSAELLQFTRTLQQMVVVSGALPQEAQAAIIQLSQGLASGTLRGEEFNSVAEQMPIFLEVLQKSLGKTRGELRKMAEAGELTPQLILGATKEAAAEIQKQYESMPLTIGRAANQLKNSWSDWINQTNNAVSVTGAVAGALSGLASNLNALGNIGLVVAVAMASRFTAGMVQSAAAMVRNSAVTAVANNTLVARAAIEVKAAQSAVAMAASTEKATLATERLALANRHLALAMRTATFSGLGQSLLALAGGPIGLAITAIFGLYAAYEYIKGKEAELDTAYQQTANSIQSNIEKTEALIEARTKLGEIGGFSERISQVDINNKAIEEAKSQLDALIQRRNELLNTNRTSVMGGLINADEINDINTKIKVLQATINDLSDATGMLADLNQQQLTAAFNEAIAAGGELAQKLKDIGDPSAPEAIKLITDEIKKVEAQMNTSVGELDKFEKKIRNELVGTTMSATQQLEAMRDEFRALGARAGKTAAELDPIIERFNMVIGLQKQLEQAKQQKETGNYLDSLQNQLTGKTKGTAARIKEQSRQKGLTGDDLAKADALAEQIEAAEKAKKHARSSKKATYDPTDKNLALNVQYLRLTGQEVKANLTDIEGRYNKLLAEFQKHSNVDGINLIKKILPLEQAKVQINGVQAELNKIYQNQSAQEQKIQAQVQVGILTHLEGQQQLKQVYANTVAEIEKQIPLLEKLAQMPGAQGEQARTMLDNMKMKIEELKSAGNEMEKAFKDGLTQGIQSALMGLAKGTMSLRDAVKNLALTVVNAMAQIAAQQLAMQTSSAVGGWLGFAGSAAGAVSAATGGYIRGAGTSTSDSIPARLSNGEYVVRAAAVSRYGVDFLHAINRGQLRQYASGGVVSSPSMPTYREPGLSDSLREGHRDSQVVASPVNIQQTLAVDSAELFTAGLNSVDGGRAVMTFLVANKETLKQALN